MPYDQYRYEVKGVFVHVIIIMKGFGRSLDIFVTWVAMMCF